MPDFLFIYNLIIFNHFNFVYILTEKSPPCLSQIKLVPPKIAPFDFGEEPSNFGDSASVQCLVTSGDLPIVFQWLFNGRPVSEVAGITTAKMGKRNTVLTIDSVTDRHVGNFTCRASNSATIANYTAGLIVNGTHTHTSANIDELFFCFCRSFVCYVFSFLNPC